jgi:hypothetical protein
MGALNFDPMIDERTEKQQKSVDRARSQSHLILRRSLPELRNLQEGRTIKEQVADRFPTPKSTPSALSLSNKISRNAPCLAAPAQNTRNAVEVRPRRS